jgi:hypothetical protein
VHSAKTTFSTIKQFFVDDLNYLNGETFVESGSNNNEKNNKTSISTNNHK